MGEVWKARDTRLLREVAIKVLPTGAASDAERLRRFEKEARAASSLNHPNIVTLYEIGQEGETSYIVLELVEGRTLRELLADGPLPVRKLLSLASQIADGLARAHESGIVHRDVKPENVMLARDGHVKILDFGLAKLSQPEVDRAGTRAPTMTRETEPGTVMGTVGYMSPEQASGEALDFRSDQFSFGSVLYEMATGRRAFDGKTRPETLAAIIREEPAPISTLNPKVPAPVRWIVERCLAKEPDARYASSRDLARDLAGVRDRISEASLSGPAAVAAPSRLRSRVVATAAVAALLAIVFLAGRPLWTRTPAPPSYRRLTFRSGNVSSARFAPDGQTVVYSARWGTEPVSIFSTRPGSVESRPLGSPGARVLSISSSGEMLILRDEVLSRVSLAGGAEREILEGVLDAAWAPNGRDIAVVKRPAAAPRASANPLVTGARLEFPIGKVLWETVYPLDSPRVSPRGDPVAVIEHPFRGDARGSIAVVNLKGERRRLSGDFSTIGSASWSPRGDEIWFSAAAASEGMAIYAVNLSGRQRIVSRGPGSQVVEDVSSDGRVLLSHWHVRRILMVFTPAQTRERDLSWLDGSRPFAFSDDGRTIYFTELGEGAGSPADSVWKRETDGSPAVRLGEGLGAGVSPDGKWVLALRFHQQPAQLFLIPTGAGEEKALTHDKINHRAAAWFPDGRRVLFIGDEPGKGPRLYVQSIEGGPPHAITEEATRGTAWATWRPISPDGLWTVWFDGEYGLYPTDGGRPRPIPGLVAGEIPIGWSSDGRALYVRDRRRTPIKAFLLDVSTGKRQVWKEIVAPVADVEFVATPDGNSYAYSYRSSSSDLYLVEGLK